MNFKAISRHVGLALLVSALFMFLSVVISIMNGLDSALAPLSISFIITFIIGAFPFIFVRKASSITLNEGYVTIVLSWLLSFLFGMLPYVLWGGPFSAVNAWFESVSGFTTTGATILDDVEFLPRSLLFWRCSTHFIGGLGVVIFLLLLIPSSNQMKLRLSTMELSSLSKDGYSSRPNKTIYIFTIVYLVLNLLAFMGYMAAGMDSFDALCHAFSVCATGGFSTKNLSIAAFDSLPVNIVSMVFMFLASIHFGMLYVVFVRRTLKPLNNPVLKLYSSMLVLGTIIIGVTLKLRNVDDSWGASFMDSAFHVLSYASTTGFGLADNSQWPYFACIVLMIFGTVCGMAGSTTGGIKSDRLLVLFKAIRLHIKQVVHPSSVEELRLGRKPLLLNDYYPHILYVAMYFSMILVSVLVCCAMDVDNRNALMATLTCLGNVGPAMGDIGTFGNFGTQPQMAKFVYTVDMFLGRVEFYPVLAALMMIFPNKKH